LEIGLRKQLTCRTPALRHSSKESSARTLTSKEITALTERFNAKKWDATAESDVAAEAAALNLR
jgi:hypothetical protein